MRETIPAPLAGASRLLDLAFAFRGSKALLTAVELGLFAVLAERPLDTGSLSRRLGLHPRGAADFFDALVALGVLRRDEGGLYANTQETSQFLDPAKPEYLGHALYRVGTRVFGNWNSLTVALRTGRPQSGAFGTSGYSGLYADDGALETFLRAMTGTSLIFARALALNFDWDRYRTIIDIGTAEGCVPVQIARAHPHLSGGGYDLPAVGPFFAGYVARHGLANRVHFYPGDFHQDPLPPADVLVMGRVLHNWGLPIKLMLLRKAYAALPKGGALIVCEALIDDARQASSEALLASLHMLIETKEGCEASGADYMRWLADAGFKDVQIRHLGCPQLAVIATK